MKITIDTKDETTADLSLAWYPDHQNEDKFDLIFGIDTPQETVSLAFTVKQAKQFAKAINFLVRHIEDN